ncbi:primosomal protein N [Flavobacterium psychrophilum]|uniref:hypothetical protein n=1 Tax=Flavobacterium psychrophilum TaxID=96345 RepID=UPI00073F7EAF|nr:hypothetical protein [Flavobacterium psychrophilum]GAQ50082.1 primosomal protein N [Flavobacterium psychrophilum]
MEFKNYMLSVSPDISIFNSADKKYIIANERIGNNVLVGKQIIDIIDLIKSGNNSQIIDLLKIKYSPFLSDEKLISIIDELINNEILIDANIENIPKKGFQKSHIKFKINILREDTINNFTYLLSKLFNKSMFFCTFIFAFFNTVTLLYVIKNNSLSYANLRFNSEFLYFIPLLLFDAFFS